MSSVKAGRIAMQQLINVRRKEDSAPKIAIVLVARKVGSNAIQQRVNASLSAGVVEAIVTALIGNIVILQRTTANQKQDTVHSTVIAQQIRNVIQQFIDVMYYHVQKTLTVQAVTDAIYFQAWLLEIAKKSAAEKPAREK
jgi:Na+-transporting NADH:ubiquinone oxidoreductase subunit NqrD